MSINLSLRPDAFAQDFFVYTYNISTNLEESKLGGFYYEKHQIKQNG